MYEYGYTGTCTVPTGTEYGNPRIFRRPYVVLLESNRRQKTTHFLSSPWRPRAASLAVSTPLVLVPYHTHCGVNTYVAGEAEREDYNSLPVVVVGNIYIESLAA